MAKVMTGRSIRELLREKQLDGDRHSWQQRLLEVTARDVEDALTSRSGSYSLSRLLTLVSPAAEPYLEQMAGLARRLTIQRFGRTIRLYAPLYLSSYCVNSCLYCGFNRGNEFRRVRLTIDEALKEADVLSAHGFRDILLVSSEDRSAICVAYLEELAGELRRRFSFVALEIYQMTASEYRRLFGAGVEGVTLYQETYDRDAYERYHVAGPKADYDMRLRGPDDMGRAGMREIGLGVLLGLADWRIETLALGEHARYLMKRYWQSHVSFSFPRLRPACGTSSRQFPNLLTDTNLVQMMLALRLCFPDAGIVLSTRESAELRNHLVGLGVTRMSAGSRTNPGGYSGQGAGSEQFEVHDHRGAAAIASMLRQRGIDLVWKDWDSAFLDA
jgi:2-iminoacetate synthase